MAGEINYFRKRFLGGFNRQDVVEYISKLAKERNESTAAKEKAENEAKKLSGEIVLLKSEIEAAKDKLVKANTKAEAARLVAEEARREAKAYKNEALEAAIKTFSGFQEALEKVNAGIRSTITGLCDEIESARSAVATVPSVLDDAAGKLEEFRAKLAAEVEQAGTHETTGAGGADIIGFEVAGFSGLYTVAGLPGQPEPYIPFAEPGLPEAPDMPIIHDLPELPKPSDILRPDDVYQPTGGPIGYAEPK